MGRRPQPARGKDRTAVYHVDRSVQWIMKSVTLPQNPMQTGGRNMDYVHGLLMQMIDASEQSQLAIQTVLEAVLRIHPVYFTDHQRLDPVTVWNAAKAAFQRATDQQQPTTLQMLHAGFINDRFPGWLTSLTRSDPDKADELFLKSGWALVNAAIDCAGSIAAWR